MRSHLDVTMELETLVSDIHALQLSPEIPLGWWTPERLRQVRSLTLRIEEILTRCPLGAHASDIRVVHDFLRTLQHLYAMHAGDMKAVLKALLEQYRIATVRELNDRIDRACERILRQVPSGHTASLVVSMWNGAQETIDMTRHMFFDGLLRFGLERMEIIIVDDASPLKEETGALMDRCIPLLEARGHEVLVLRSSRNLGYTHSYNVGLRRSTGDVVFVSNTDVRISPGAMEVMASALRSAPGIVGPMLSNAGYKPQLVENAPALAAYSPEEMGRLDRFAEGFNRLNVSAHPFAAPFVCGSFMGIHREVFGAVGFLDERFTHGYAEEIDFCYRAQQKGFGAVVCRNIFVFHGGIATSKLLSSVGFSSQTAMKKKSPSAILVQAALNQRHFIRNHGLATFVQQMREWISPRGYRQLPPPRLPPP